MSSDTALQKQKRDSETGLANAPLKKKIGFFSAMIMVIGSVMGAGIFFKSTTVLKYSQNSLIFFIFAWLIGVFAVISMVLALIEISSARNDNLSLIGWCQTFNNRVIFKACKNFMVYLYIPLSYFFLPLYVIMSLQDGLSYAINGYSGIGTNIDWVIIMVFTLVMSMYFIIACGLSSKLGNIQNWIISSINMAPAVIAIVVGISAAIKNNGIVNTGIEAGFNPIDPTYESGDMYSFGYITPGFGLFLAVGAIFFAYDGFYVTAGIQSELKEPKNISSVLVLGLFAVTFIYLSIAIAMSIGETQNSGFELFNHQKWKWLGIVFNVTIGVGVLSILNAFGIWTPRLFENLIKTNELPFSKKYLKKLNDHRPKVGVLYNLSVVIPVILVFCTIGGLAYVNKYGSNYGVGVGKLYSFADLMATWSSVGAFTFIVASIFGALNNRKTKKIIVKKSKYLPPCAILCLILAGPAILLTYLSPIFDLFLLYRVPHQNGFETYYLIPRLMIVIVLFVYLSLTFLPTIFEDHYHIKKFGSLDNYNLYNLKILAIANGLSLKAQLISNIESTKIIKLERWQQEVLKQKQLSHDQIKLVIANSDFDYDFN